MDGCRVLKEKELRGLIERNLYAAKGDAGRVLVIGGSERYIGAAVLAGLSALRSGVDSVVIAAPEMSARLMNAFSPDLVTVKLPGDDLGDEHIEELGRLAENATCVLIGPGMGVSEERRAWLDKLIPRINKPIVLDADATKQVRLIRLERSILFANGREYEELKETNHFTDDHVGPSLGTNILVIKGREDRIICADGSGLIEGGHPRATVAGTGDVLSGLAAGIYAQTQDPRVAAQAAAIIAKRCAEKLADKLSYGFLASDMVYLIPGMMKELRIFRETKYLPNGKLKGKA